ncbi:MAG: hypothetical protein IPH12_22435 [Saprospirales bacterium]|nr:hypothetical protein [Saprospirales bacterium]
MFSSGGSWAFQAYEAQVLLDVNYYLWLNNTDTDAGPYRFLYAIELIFEQGGALLLSSGEDTAAIRVIPAETLIQTARDLQALHGQVCIQQVHAGPFPLWLALGHPLKGIRLSNNGAGLYLNDALALDFGQWQIMVQLSKTEGLEMEGFR